MGVGCDELEKEKGKELDAWKNLLYMEIKNKYIASS